MGQFLMQRKVLFGKIHRARVTAARPDYIGSITIDADLLDATGIRPNDAVVVANCDTGARFETYAVRGEPGSGAIEINGAAAHLAKPGHVVIIMHYAMMDDAEYSGHRPRVALMRADNSVDELIRYGNQAPELADIS
jgi:aspartate 1-decarboxylase